ncbi:MAG TPA: FG-GAP-like repeat-containing protein [Thermoanaerobaculia bacterium]
MSSPSPPSDDRGEVPETAPGRPAGDAPGPPLRPGPRAGRRRRRLRWTAALLAVVALAALVLGAWAWRSGRPDVRRPGESLDDVTDRLAQGVPAEAPRPVFTDVTAAAGLDGFRSFAGRRGSRLPEDMGAGAAWGDFDGDGDDDLFVVAAGGSLDLPPQERRPSRLYENLGDGTFRPVAGFPDTRVLGMAAAWGDADGDGDLDLAVSGYRDLLLFRNLGGGRFERDRAFPSPDGYWAGLAWGDFDDDGDLDLYVCGYVRYVEAGGDGPRRESQQYGAAVPYTLNPAAFEPEPNLLFENRGDGGFDEVAVLYGVSNPAGRSLGALWHDFDDDGRLDLYVANDISDNAFYLNRGDTFEDAGLAAWVADYRGAMGLAAGDWNRDGDDDLFVTHWLAQENALYDSRLRTAAPSPEDGLLAAAPGAPPRLTFSDLSAPLGLGPIALPMVGWGTELLDFDRDGWLDLVVANGSTLEDKADPARLVPQKPFLLWNRRGEAFHDLAPLAPPLAEPRSSRGLAVADYDADGDLDLLVVDLDGGVRLLRNDTAGGRHLTLALADRRPGGGWGRGEAAVAVAWVGGVPLRRTVGGSSYLSQSSATLHFGLGDAAQVDRLEVRWPDGEVESYGPLPADSRWRLAQGEAAPVRLDDPAAESAGRGRSARRTAGGAAPAAASNGPAPGAATLDRRQVVAFWAAHRAGMDAMKRQGDLDTAIGHFRRALALDPSHEDARYYLADCLWLQGHRDEAMGHLDEMRRRSPGSQRAHRQWATLRAATAGSAADLAAAAAAAERALAINREETGALLLLGEIALLQGQPRRAAERLELACRTNPRAVGGFFLRGYVAWSAGDRAAARDLLRRAAEARGPDWKPQGTVAEGDVAARMHRDESPLAVFWESWDGGLDPDAAFGPLAARLARRPGTRTGSS